MMESAIPIRKILSKSKSKPTDVWCLDPLGEHLIKFDRLDLCSQIKAIPIEDVITILEDLKLDIEAKINYYEQVYKEPSNLIHETAMCGRMFGCGECEELVKQKINEIKESNDE